MKRPREVMMMRQRTPFVPDVMPHLSAGRHRNPRRGACFMEFASYLAGERWSDHPACTDRSLAALARGVNDLVSDGRRDELIPLIPRVVGLTGPDVLGQHVALRAALEAMPVASMERQRVLAAGALALAARLDRQGALPEALARELAEVLDDVPDAARWARAHVATISNRYPRLDSVSSELIIATAVVGASRACIDDPDGVLIAMLEKAVDAAEQIVGRDRPAPARRLQPTA